MNRHYGNEECKAYVDMHELLTRPDLDAMVIATGDCWHGTASIYAGRAGKNVYCEKPCTMTIAECQELDAAILDNKRIYQGGMQRRNVDNFQVAADPARTGTLGKLHTLHAGIWLPQPVKPNLPAETEPDPSLIDWNRWLGPLAGTGTLPPVSQTLCGKAMAPLRRHLGGPRAEHKERRYPDSP